jgi:bifunctional enzyme CysN/CysC
MRLGTRVATVQAASIERVVHGDLLEYVECNDESVVRANDVAEVVFKSREILGIDDARSHAGLGRLILLRDLEVVAGGTILEPVGASDGALAHNLVPVDHQVDRKARAWRNGYRGAVIWLTGLPAAGKSTIAMNVERRLFEKGYVTYVLDGDNIRSGLCSDLGFSPEERRENVRRVAEVANLFADAGTILIAALVSPFRADRDAARFTVGDAFHEIYVRADAALCEERDPKGHYRLARAGMMTDFTGISGEYEPPRNPELVIDTGMLSLADSVSAVVRYIEQQVGQVGGNETLADAIRNG